MAGEWNFNQEGAQRGVGGLIEEAQDFDQATYLLGVDAFNANHIYMREFFQGSEGIDITTPTTTGIHPNSGLYINLLDAGDVGEAHRYTLYTMTPMSWSKPRRLKTAFYNYNTNRRLYIRTGTWLSILDSYANPGTDRHFGFWIVNNAVYGSTANGTNYTALDLSTTLSDSAMTPIMEAILNPGVSVSFYIAGVLVGVITTNIPTGTTLAESMYAVGMKSVGDGGVTYVKFREIVFLQGE